MDHSVYEWKAKEELAMSANSVGNYQLCHDLCIELLFNPAVPEQNRKTVTRQFEISKRASLKILGVQYKVNKR